MGRAMNTPESSSDKGIFVRGMMWSSGGNLVAMGAAMLTVILAVRLLDKTEMGAFFLVMVIAQISITLGDFGLRNTSIKVLSSAEKDEMPSISSHLLTLRFVSALLTCLVLSTLIPILSSLWSQPEFRAVIWYAVPVSFLMMLFQMGLALFVGYRRFRQFSLVTAVMEVFRMAASIVLLLLGWGPAGLLLGFILSRVLGLLWLLRVLPFHFRPTLSHPLRGRILRFGGWLHGGSVMSVINAKVVDALLTTFMGTAALAVYSTALQIPNVTLKFFESVRPVLLSYIASLKLAASGAAVLSVRLLTALLAVAAGFVITFAGPLIALLYSSKYLSGTPIMQVLSVWVAVSIINYYLSLTLIGTGRPKQVFLLTLPQFATMIAGTLLLVPRLSGLGAALVLLMTATLGNAISIWLVSEGSLLLYRRLLSAFLRSALPMLVVLLLAVITRPPLVLRIFYYLASIVTLFAFRALTPADLRTLHSHARRKRLSPEPSIDSTVELTKAGLETRA
jgi:O-antigen/teichoic acid export membrane protein